MINVRQTFRRILRNSHSQHINMNKSIKIIDTSLKGNRKEDISWNNEMMLQSKYLLIFCDQQWSYRFRDGLLTTNILVLIGLDHFILPYENIINYTQWFDIKD